MLARSRPELGQFSESSLKSRAMLLGTNKVQTPKRRRLRPRRARRWRSSSESKLLVQPSQKASAPSWTCASMALVLGVGALAAIAHPSNALSLAIEVSFGEQMSARERKSLAHQIVRAYGHNQKAARPLRFHLTGLEATASHPDMLPADGSWRHWQHCERVAATAEEHWLPSQLIWLSPDAEEPLIELPAPDGDAPTVLVVGGIIDRTVERGISLERARAQGALCRRLPLREFAPRPDVDKVLSVLAVVQMVAAVHSGLSWPDAIATSLPARYVKRREAEEQSKPR